ncbi:MAG: DMT family transporter, partial [Actinomycetota bacterium]
GLIAWLRLLLGASALRLVPAARTRIERADMPRLVALSLLWVGIPSVLFPLAEQRITSGVTGLLNGGLPIFAVAIGSLMLRRVPARTQAFGLAVGFLGIAAIATPALRAGGNETIGVGMGLLATVCYGVAINIAAPLTQRYGATPVIAGMLALASVWTAPLGILQLRTSSFAWPSVAATAALGLLGTGFAFVLMGRLVARVGPSRASFATYLIPVVALILGAVFRHEAVHPLSIVGIALVIAGALLASRKERSA